MFKPRAEQFDQLQNSIDQGTDGSIAFVAYGNKAEYINNPKQLLTKKQLNRYDAFGDQERDKMNSECFFVADQLFAFASRFGDKYVVNGRFAESQGGFAISNIFAEETIPNSWLTKILSFETYSQINEQSRV